MKAPRPSPHLLAALALALALLRHRKPLEHGLARVLDSVRRALGALHRTSNLLAETCNDLCAYVRPPAARRAQLRGRRAPPPARQVVAPTVPRSIRRVMRLLACEDALAVVHNIAGGAARGLAREMHQATRGGKHVQGEGVQAVVETLASPCGQRLVNGAVCTAVREGVKTFVQCQQQQRGTADGDVDWVQKIMEAVLSERGQALTVKLARELTRCVVPMVLEGGGLQAGREGGEADQAGAADEVSTCTMSAQTTALAKRRMSLPKQGTAAAVDKEWAVTRQLVRSVMRAQGRMGVIERLALLAIRDKALVRDVVRTVVSEAIRTYLTTQAELRVYGGGASDGRREVQQSVWKCLIRSALVDVKRALVSRGAANTGWVIF